jgi:hypothetical protein
VSYSTSQGSQIISFDVDVFRDALDAACDETAKIIKQAIYSTMSRVRRYARTLLSDEIRNGKKWNVQKKELDPRIVVKASERGAGYESFEMTIRGMSISMAYFSGTQQLSGAVRVARSGKGGFRSLRGKRAAKEGGVQVQVIQGKKRTLPRAWLHFAASGHVAVLQRRGKKRTPIVVKAVISPASMFNDHKTADNFEEKMIAYIEKTFEHELMWRLQRAGLA